MITKVRVGTTVAAAIGLAVSAAAPSGATAPGRDGLRAFVGYSQILTYRPSAQGGDTRVLTTSGDNRHPRWSQDGARLVFYTKQGAVKTIKPDGTALRTVVPSGGYLPTWQSPSRIAFVKVTGGKGDIYSVAATGGALTRLTRDGASTCGNSHPAFSYDGRYLAYIQDRPTGGTCTSPKAVLKVVDRRTGAVRVVESANLGGDYPVVKDRVDFLADGRHVLFNIEDEGCEQLWAVMDVTDGTFESHDYTGCEGGGEVGEAYPLPSGPIDNVGIGPTAWNQIDVQPLRP